eukprot:CFRG8310T1
MKWLRMSRKIWKPYVIEGIERLKPKEKHRGKLAIVQGSTSIPGWKAPQAPQAPPTAAPTLRPREKNRLTTTKNLLTTTTMHAKKSSENELCPVINEEENPRLRTPSVYSVYVRTGLESSSNNKPSGCSSPSFCSKHGSCEKFRNR